MQGERGKDQDELSPGVVKLIRVWDPCPFRQKDGKEDRVPGGRETRSSP